MPNPWPLALGVAALAGVVTAVTTVVVVWIGFRLIGCPRCRHHRRLLHHAYLRRVRPNNHPHHYRQ